MDSINDQSNRTGVTASLNNAGDEITLVDQDGDNVEVRRTDSNDNEWTINAAHADEKTGSIKLKSFENSLEALRVLEEGVDEDGNKIMVHKKLEAPDGSFIPLYYGDRATDSTGASQTFEESGKLQYWVTDAEENLVYMDKAHEGRFVAENQTYNIPPTGEPYTFVPNKDDEPQKAGETREELNLCVVRGYVKLECNKNFSANAGGVGDNFINKYDKSRQSATLEPVNDINITTQEGANNGISVVDGAIATIDQIRSVLGAIQNRFSATIANLSNVAENISSSKSRILDADFAKETAELTKAQILQEAGLSMLAQANKLPESALKLLG